MKFLRGCSHKNLIKIFLSFAMVICIMALSACRESADKNSLPNSNSSNSNTNASSVDNNSIEEVSSGEEVNSNNVLSGTLSAQSTFSVENIIETESDKPYNCASLNNPVKGSADKEAEKLRSEIINSKNTEELYKIKGKTYYISANGSNENDGLSKKTPFKSIDALDGVELKSGDAVLFERGSIFRLTRSLNCMSGIIYGSYGKGNKPALYLSPKNYGDISYWKPTKKKNVWVVEFPYADACSIVLGYGSEIGYRRTKGLQELDVNYEFYHNNDSGYVYLYCDLGNPGKIFKSVEIIPQGSIINVDDGIKDIVIDNLCLKYAGNFGVKAGCIHNAMITNCEIGFIGGSQYAGTTTRYGNGIQFWQGGTDITVEYNWVYQTFDSAITWQGQTKRSGKGPTVYKNIHFDNNLLEYNNADYEFFDSEGASIENFTMDNNIMRFTCLGWGTRIEDFGIRGIEGSIRGSIPNMKIKKISVQNNIFDTAAREIISWSCTEEQAKEIFYKNNNLFATKRYRKDTPVIANIKVLGTKVYANNQAELQNAFDSQCGKDAFKAVWVK